ncbi:cation diffusion facilitator family transporter [Alloalcanivorax sp. C16-2]|uniref:cation diffusion facilitator family transporter n=1 Tax=Alloalcanivorax TaxID=3020832 RepID=UPI001932E37B|nr:cation diffusion facilitator family transporter [Alloalcanivorax marinus]MBL7251150.1 cation transporter [Alloalcanivorax marinus]
MSGSRKVVIAAMAGNMLIAVTKFVAAVITGSSAMLSEGIHSLVDTGNGVLLLHGMKRAKTPANERFPFGHGKEVYFWAFAVAILIFALGAGISLYEGVVHLMHPEPISNPIINYVVLGLAMVFEGTAWSIALKEFRRTKGDRGYVEAISHGKDPTTFVVLFEDSAAMLGLVVALLGVLLSQLTGAFWFDGLASILIGLILAGTACWLAYETKGLLIGEAANPRVVAGIRRAALSMPSVDAVNEVLTMHMGPDFILVNISVTFSPSLGTRRLETVIAELDRTLKAQDPRIKRVFVEAESPAS